MEIRSPVSNRTLRSARRNDFNHALEVDEFGTEFGRSSPEIFFTDHQFHAVSNRNKGNIPALVRDKLSTLSKNNRAFGQIVDLPRSKGGIWQDVDQLRSLVLEHLSYLFCADILEIVKFHEFPFDPQGILTNQKFKGIHESPALVSDDNDFRRLAFGREVPFFPTGEVHQVS